MRYDGMTVYEVAEALGHDVCETCKEQVCTNPGHGGCCTYDGPGYQVEGLTWCKVCGPAARLENEPTLVEGIPLVIDDPETTPIKNISMRDIVEGRLR